MNQNLMYFLSVVIGAISSYLINQLPGVPDAVKPWLWAPVILLTVFTCWLGLRLNGAEKPKRSQQVLTDITAKNIRVGKVTVENKSGEPVDQQVARGLKADGDVDLGDVSVK